MQGSYFLRRGRGQMYFNEVSSQKENTMNSEGNGWIITHQENWNMQQKHQLEMYFQYSVDP